MQLLRRNVDDLIKVVATLESASQFEGASHEHLNMLRAYGQHLNALINAMTAEDGPYSSAYTLAKHGKDQPLKALRLLMDARDVARSRPTQTKLNRPITPRLSRVRPYKPLPPPQDPSSPRQIEAWLREQAVQLPQDHANARPRTASRPRSEDAVDRLFDTWLHEMSPSSRPDVPDLLPEFSANSQQKV